MEIIAIKETKCKNGVMKLGDIVSYANSKFIFNVTDIYQFEDGDIGVDLESLIKDEFWEPISCVSNACPDFIEKINIL